jgi:WD40 repeat protein
MLLLRFRDDQICGVSCLIYRLVGGGLGGFAACLDPDSGFTLTVQTSHGGYLRKTLLSPNGQLLATIGSDADVKIWNAATSQEIWSFHSVLGVAELGYSPIAFSGDSQQIAIAGDAGTITVVALLGGDRASVKTSIPVITRLSWSPDNQWIGVGGFGGKVAVVPAVGSSNEIVLNDPPLPTRDEIALATSNPTQHMLPFISSLLFSRDSGSLFVGTSTGGVFSYQLSDRVKHGYPTLRGLVVALSFSSDTLYGVTKLLDEKTDQIWDVTNGRQLFEQLNCDSQIDIPDIDIGAYAGIAYGICFNPREKKSKAFLWSLSKGIYELPTGLIGTFDHPPSVSADGSQLVTVDKDKRIWVTDIAFNHASVMEGTHLQGIEELQSLSGGDQLLIQNSEQPFLWSLNGPASVTSIRSFTGRVAMTRDGRRTASFDSKGQLIIVDNVTGQILLTAIHDSLAYQMRITDDGSRVFWIDGNGYGGFAKSWSIGDDRARVLCESDYRGALTLSSTGRYLAVGCNHGTVNSTSAEILLFDTSSMKIKQSFWSDLHTLNGMSVAGIVGGFAFSDDDKRYATSLFQRIEIREIGTSQPPRTINADLEHGRLFIGPICFFDRNSGIATTEMKMSFFDDSASTTKPIHPGAEWLLDLIDIGSDKSILSAPLEGFPTSLLLIKKLLLVGQIDGRVSGYDLPSLKQVVTLIHPAGWLAVTPEGLFDGDPQAFKWVGWRVKSSREIVPLDLLYETYSFPELLPKIVSGERPVPAIDIGALFGLPSLQLMLEEGYAHIDQDGDKRFLCLNEKQDDPSKRVELYSDGSPIELASDQFTQEHSNPSCPWSAPLPLGAGKIEARVISTAKASRCDFTTPSALYHSVPSGTLHVLTVAVSDYDRASQGLASLPSADASATALEQYFKNRLPEIASSFKEIDIRPGLRAGATPPTLANIEKSWQELIAKTKPEDTVILFLSGHGQVALGTQMFYFAPGDYDPSSLQSRRSTGLSTAMIADMIRRLPARHLVILLDACQSGAAFGSLAKIAKSKTDGLTSRESSLQTGTYLIASATALHIALGLASDSPSPFVQSILQALDQQSDHRRHKSIMAGHIAEAVCKRLPQWPGGGETPIIFHVGSDFPLSH